MASWTDLSSAFGANTILTSAQQQQLRENITAAFEKASGAPVLADEYVTSSMLHADVASVISSGGITHYKVASGAVWNNNLSYLCVSSGHLASNSVLQSNIYAGAVCQAKLETDTEELSYDIINNTEHVFQLSNVAGYFFLPQTAFETGVTSGWYATYGGKGDAGHTTFQTFITLYQNNHNGYDRYGYVKARYITASGDKGWLFVIKNENSNRIKAASFSFDHPCWGKSGDPEKHPHPFTNEYVSKSEKIYCIMLTREQHKKIDNENDLSFLQNITQNYDIDTSKPTKWPKESIPVKLDSKYNHICRKIAKPDYIIMAGLKKK